MAKYFLSIGATLAGLSVMAGAFGAHMLEGMVSSNRLATFETGVKYQMYHALALIILGWILTTAPGESSFTASIHRAGYCFLAGIVIFSGSLYVLVLTDTPWLGAITPIGGVALIIGWFMLAYSTLSLK